MNDVRHPLWRGRMLALSGIVLVAFSLRSAVGVLSPMLGLIEADFAVPTWVVGVIGAAPPVAFALFGIVTPRLERRFGLEHLAVVAMVVAGLGTAGRALAPNVALLVVGTMVLFAAIGIGNVVLPPLIKRYFPDRIGAMMAVYSTTLAVSSLLPPAIAVPVADAAGWRFSLGMWAIFCALAAVPWVGMVVRARRDIGAGSSDAPRVSMLSRMWRLPVAWSLAISFSVTAALAYTSFAWLPQVLIDDTGISAAGSGALLSLFAATGLPVSIAVPLLVTRYPRSVGWLFAIAVATGFAGVGGLILAPAVMTILWVVLFGTAQLLFPLVLALIQVRSATPGGSVALSGFTQSIGYALAVAFPLLFGMLHEATGSWTPPLVLIAVLFGVAIPAGAVASRSTTVEEEWSHRYGSW